MSTAILCVAVFTTWTSVHQRGPFTAGSPHENAISIQTFFPLLSFALVPMAAVFTEKKKMSEALHASEQRYRMVLETQSDLLCRCYCDTTLTFVNDSWCRFFGRSREELLGGVALGVRADPRHQPRGRPSENDPATAKVW